MKNVKIYKNKSGISMLALVVTIIVLLILAGITISVLVGNNGIISKTEEARDITDFGKVKEEILKKWLEVEHDNVNNNISNQGVAEVLQSKLKPDDKDAKAIYRNENETIEVGYKGYEVEITTDGEITTARKDAKAQIKEAWEKVTADTSLTTNQSKIDKLADELGIDTSKITIDQDGNVKIDGYNDYTETITTDEQGNIDVAIKEDEKPTYVDRASVSISANPESQTVFEGTDVSFTVTATGTGEITYKWYEVTSNTGIGGQEIDLNKKDDKIEGTDKSKYIVSEDGKTLTVRNTGEDDEKYYYCEVTSTYTNPKNNKTTTDKEKSDTAKLTVATGIQVAKDKIVVDEGETIELEILVDDDGQTTYQWYKKAPEGSTQDQKIDGATSPTYEKTNAIIEDEGEYYCEVTQTVGEETKTIQSEPIKVYVKVPIKITSEPTDTKAIEGESASLNVGVDGGGIITYQWYKTLPNANTGGTPIPGATDKTYNIPETTIYDDSYYYCEIKQTFPVDNSEKIVKTSPAKITIIEKVTINTQPISQNVLEETPASFTITTNSSGEITYQWYKAPNSTATGTAIEGATSNTYSIDKTTTEDNGYYYCKVTQKYGEQTQTVDSNRAQLTVVSKVAITEQPKSVNTIAKKENVTFSITTSGQGTIAYQWYHATNSQEPGTAIEGATSNTYTIPQSNVTTELNGGYYYCVVTQTYNGRTATVTSSKALLTVVAPVSIAANPTDVTVINESTATFKVEAVGISVPDLIYQWYKADDATSTGTPISGANQSTYTTPATTAEDDGKYYYCIVTQKYGDATSTITTERALLTVGQSGSIGDPSNTSAIEYKNSVSFTAVATGSGEITYQWYKNTTQAVSGASLIEGATSSTYTIPAEEVKTSINNTYYYCIATQKYGESTKQITSGIAKLTVVAQTKITSNPANDQVIAGVKDVAFAVQVEGESNPTFTYQWYKNTTGSNTEGTAITGATSNTYSINKSDITTSMNGTYYYCVITQKYGTSTHETNTTAAKLTVVAPAEVTKNPTAVSVIAGITDVSFSANGSGSGAISFQWYYATSPTGGTPNKVEGATSSTYSIPAANVTTSHNGRYYYAEITQTYNGQTYTLSTNRALLTAVAPVKFTTQPNNATLTAGHSASFSSLAIGTSIPDITYQWYKADSITGEGEAISGATSSSYTTPRLTEQDDGKYYYVVATQKYGTPNEGTTTAISNRALLTIGEAGTITNPIDVSAVEKNNQVSFTVTKSGAGTFTYQWYKTDQAGAENPTEDASKAITNATSATYTIPASDVTIDLNNTYYYCVAKQTYGSSNDTMISTAAKLSVVEQVTIESQPTNVSTIEGKTATYTVEATGEGTITYQWYSSTTNSNTGGTPISGATDPTYTTPTLTTSNDDTYYYCVVTQTYGTSTHTETTTPAKLTVTEATQITTQPTAQQKLEGNTATFTVEASGEGTKTYQWYRVSTPTGGTPELIEGATSSTYTTPETNINNDNGKYYFCIVTQNYGEPEVQSTAISDRALLTVKARSKITTEPQAQSKIAGNKATFTVAVDGEGTKSYQWYVANDEASDGTAVSGATGASYTTPATTVEGDNGKYYYVVVTQTYNGQKHTVTSKRALLTVVDRLEIKTQPISQGKLVDNKATFNVVTTGGGTITYQWYVSNTNSNTSGTALNNGVGAKTDTYTTDKLTTSDNNKWYYVVVTQDYEGQQVVLRSSTAKLEVVARTQITTQPKSVGVITNENDVTFTAAASGSGTITYQWYVADTSTATGTPINGATSETYTIDKADVTTSLNGKYYYCIATQTYNGQQATAITNKALLTVVSKATIGTQPSNVTVTEGKTATFATSANGTSLPDFTYQWYVADSATAAGTAISGANTAQYTIPATTIADDGKYYYCIVTQKYGISETTVTTTRAKLTVGEGGSLSSPSDVNAIAGKNNVTFTVTPSGANTESFTYQWYKSNTNNPVEDASKAISGATSASYTIPAANVTTAIDDTYYYCIAKQTYGSSTNTIISTSAHLEVIPEFNLTSTQPRDVTVISGITDANFSVEVDTTAMDNAAGGKGTIAYQWYSNTANSTSGATKITTGGTAGTYTSPRSSNTATGSDVNRYYYCVVTQKFGVSTVTKTSRIAKLTITPAVTITSPTSLGKIVGDTAQFSVTATGTVNSGQELTYQWYKADSETGAGTAIPTTTGTGSQTPTYTTPATDIANYNNKWYYCIVTQKYGDPNEGVTTATSSRAKLSVVAVGGITAQPQSVSVVQGNQDVTFSVAATGQSNLTYQWYKNTTNSNSGGTAISGATSATYTIAKASATTAITNTFYYCVVKQAYEQSPGRTFTSNPAQLTVGAANYTTGNVYYEKLADAINAAANNGTVTQLLDMTGDNSDESNVVVSGKTVTFNNNGKTLNKTAYGITVNSGATLTISGSGTITTAANFTLINNSGTLNLTHTGTISTTHTGAGHLIFNAGTLNKTGSGTITSSRTNATIGSIGANATLTTSAGTIINSNNNYAIDNYAGSALKVQGSARLEGPYGIHLGHSTGVGTLEMTGGTIVGNYSHGIVCANSSTATITGGTVTGKTNGIHLENGTVNVGSTSSTFNRDNPVIQGEQYGINKTGGTWNFYNGILKGKTAGYTGGDPTAVRTGYWVTNDNMDGNYHTSVLKLIPTLTLNKTTLGLVYAGSNGTITITYNGDGALSAVSSNTGIATTSVSGNTITVTPVTAGTATITVSAAEGSDYLATGSRVNSSTGLTCTVTVDKRTTSITATPPGDIVRGNQATFTASSSPSIAGKWEISTNPTDILTIDQGNTTTDATSREFKYTGAKAGTTTVTLTFTPTDSANNKVATKTFSQKVLENYYKVGSTYYNTLSAAYGAVAANGTITVWQNVPAEATSPQVSKAVTLALQGYTLTKTSSAITVTTNGNLTITGTTAGTLTTALSYPITVSAGTLNVNTGNVISTNASGIGINMTGGTVNVGVNGNGNTNRSVTDPQVRGTSYGVSKSGGTWNFYNGKVLGTTAAYNGNPSAVRTGCAIAAITTESVSGVNYKKAILKVIPTLTIDPTTMNFTYATSPATQNITISYNGDGKVSSNVAVTATSSDTEVAKVSVGSSTPGATANPTITSGTGTVTVTAVNVGTATITFSAAEGENYVATSNKVTSSTGLTSTVTVKQHTISYTAVDRTYNYDGAAHTYDGVTITDSQQISEGVKIYYSTSTSLNDSNYSTAGSETKPTRTNAGQDTVYWYIKPTKNYGIGIAGNNKLTVRRRVYYDYNYLNNDLLGTKAVDISQWDAYSTVPTAKTVTDDSSARSGSVLEFTMPNGTVGGPYVRPANDFTVGQKYTWSVYVKASSAKTLNIGPENGGYKSVNVTTNWQRITYTFTAIEHSTSTNYAMVFYLNGSSWTEGDKLYIHSLELNQASSLNVSSPVYLEHGATLGTLPTLSRTGYTGANWHTAPTGGSQIATTTNPTANSTTYYAHWTCNKVYLDLNGWLDGASTGNISGYGTADVKVNGIVKSNDTADFCSEVYYGSSYEITDIKAATGHTYNGVYSGSATGTVGVSRINVYLNFTTNEYTVAFNGNGGSNGTSITKKYGQPLGTLPTSTRSGYTFQGWFTETSGGTQITAETTMPLNGATYYAHWVDDIKPAISAASASTTWDIENYVDFTATDAGEQSDSGTGIVAYNINQSSTTAPTTWIPTISTVEPHTETKYELNAAWARVFHHNNHWGEADKYFGNATNAQSYDSVDMYSVLGSLDNYKNNSNKYEFLLQYPLISSIGYNRWIQDKNPTTISSRGNDSAVEGYTPVTVTWTGNNFGGLEQSGGSAYLDGQTGSGYWWFAIGTYANYSGGMPGPNSMIASVANLWSRIDTKTTTPANSLSRRLGDVKANGTYYVWVKDKSGNTANKQVSISKVDTTNPTASITATNNVATSQTATLSIGDNQGAVAYAWSKNLNPQSSIVTWTPITSTTSTTVTKTVDSEGTYYLGVKDTAGNIAVTNQTFYKTTLQPTKSAVTPTSVITLAGNTFNLPTPTAVAGYTFDGWYTAEQGGTKQATSYKPTGNVTLYAHFTPNNYTLSVNPNSGTWNSSTSTQTFTQAYGTEKSIANPTRTGYNFNGWTLADYGRLGESLHTDSYFASGGNGCYVYNNTGNGTVTITRQAKSSDNTTGGAYELKVQTSKTATPGWGGFYQNTGSAASQKYVHVFIAKLPVGFQFQYAMNATGDGRTVDWLTSRNGTGNFEVYAYQMNAGSTGSFSTFGHVYVVAPTDTSVNAPIFYIAYSDIFNITNTKGTKYTFGLGSNASTAGNGTLTANWIDNIKPAKPTVTAKYGDNNATYTSGTWTNRQVYTDISSTDEGVGIKKFQYSLDNKSTWNDLILGKSGGMNTNGITASGQENWGISDGRNITVYIRAVDNNDNISDPSDPINIKYDTSAPTISVSPANATACKSKSVTITAEDPGTSKSGLASSNSYQYYLSTSSTALSGGEWTNYTNGTAFTLGSGKTGTFYLFVKRVSDVATNVSTTNGTAQAVSGTTYQRFGSYVFDNTAPTLSTIVASTTETTPKANYYKANQKITFTATFTESISSTIYGTASQGAITSSNAPALKFKFGTNGTERTATFVSVNGKTITYEYTIASDDNGALTKTSYTGTVYDGVGNAQSSINGVAITGTTVIADNTAPTITVSPANAAACKSTNVTITVADAHSGLKSDNSYQYYLSSSSTALSGGEWTNYTSGTAFSIGSGITGDRYLFVKRVNDALSNTSTTNGTAQAVSGTTYQRFGTYVFDNTATTLSSINVTGPNAGTYKAGQEVTIVATFNENIYGTASQGAISSSNAPTLKIKFGNGTERTATYNTASGATITYKYTIAAGDNGKIATTAFTGTVYDVAGNSTTCANVTIGGNDITADTTGPTCTITAQKSTSDTTAIGSPTNASSITYKFTWSESVTGFIKDDVTVTNGTKGDFSGSGTTYYLVVTNNYTTTVTDQTVSVPANKCTDTVGNNNVVTTTAPASLTRRIDRVAPTCTITAQKSTSDTTAIGSPTNASSITYKFTFNENVTGFATGDITVTNGTKGDFSGSNNVYYLVVTNTYTTEVKDQKVEIAASCCTDAAGNGNATASLTRRIDRVAPTITITAQKSTSDTTAVGSPSNLSSITYKFFFSESVTGFEKADIAVTNGTAGDFSGSGQTYYLVVTNTYTTEAKDQTVSVAASKCIDSAGNGNATKSLTIKIDRVAPATATITSTNNVATSQTATLTMGDNVGVVAYYWGTSNPSSTSVTYTTITSATSKTETKTVDAAGTYYLSVKDAAGNVTTVNKAFYKTTLTPNNGSSVTPTSVITMSGNTFTLPTPTAVAGYTFSGWYTAASGGTQYATSYTPSSSVTMQGQWGAKSYKLTKAAGISTSGSANLLANGTFENYSEVASPAWDVSLNSIPGNTSKAYSISSWGTGYNGGVNSPSVGYHAHMKLVDNNAVLDYHTNESTGVGTNRWLGFAQGITASKLTAGHTYTITMDVYRVSGSSYITSGLYYQTNANKTSRFVSGCPAFTPTATGTWQTISWSFTLDSDYYTGYNPALYIYGSNGSGGECYVDNVQLYETAPTDKNYNVAYTSTDVATPTRTGYTFAGWYNNSPAYSTQQTTSKNFTSSNATFQDIGTAGTLATIYGKWTPNAITFANSTPSAKTFSTSSQTISIATGTGNVAPASGGTGNYKYVEVSEKNSSNTATSYISVSGTTITLAAGTPADTYTYVVRAIDQESHQTKDATITITVNKATVTLSNIPSSLQYVAKNTEKTVSATASVAGTWTVSSNSTNISITSGASTSNNTAGTFKYKGVTPSTTAATITVKFTPTSSNYEAPADKTFTVKATECIVAPTNITAYVGGGNKTVTLSGTNAGTFTATNSDSSKATTSISGSTLTITPVAAGSTTITVKEGNGNATATVSVTVKSTTCTVSPASVTAYVGGVAQTVTLGGTNAGTFTATNSDSSKATTSISGSTLTITPVAAGSTTITVKEGNGNATATVSVTVKATTITASPTSVTAYVGGAAQTVTLGGTNAGTFTATNSDSSKATASISGSTLTITPVAAGSTKITVKEGNGNKTVEVNVTVKATTITASPASVTAYVGGAAQTVTLGGTNAGTFSLVTTSPATPNTSIATVSLSGSTLTVTPVAAGTTSVTVKEGNGNQTKTINITVIAVGNITANPTSVTAYVGGANKTVALGGTNVGTFSLVTTSPATPNTSIATASLSGSTLTVTPVASGTTSVKVKESNANKELTIPITVLSTSITAQTVTVYVGGSDKTVTISGLNMGQLSITDGTNATTKENTYAKMTLNQSNNQLTVKPKAAGTTTVALKEANGNKTATINITVSSTTCSVSPTSGTGYVGGSNLTAILSGTNAGGFSVSDNSNSSVATASVSGTTLTITPKAEGTATITVKEANGNKTATYTVTVRTTSVSLSPTSGTGYVGGSNLTSTITKDTNAGTVTVDTSASGYNASVATASVSGNTLTIVPVGAGTATITVKEGNGNKTATYTATIRSTSVSLSPTSGTGYVGGSNLTSTITKDTNAGTVTVDTSASGYNASVATASVSGNTLTIVPVGAGTATITVKEANGNKTATYTATIRATSVRLRPESGTIVLGNGNLTSTITKDTYAGTVSVSSNSNSSVATASISGSTLTITPVAVGTATITIKEANGNKTAKYTVTVTAKNYQVSSGSPTYHTELATAYTAVGAEGIITVLADNTDTSTVTIDKNVTLNTGSAKTVTRTKTITVNSGKTLTITGTGKITSSSSINTITNNGTFSMATNATIENTVYNGGKGAISNSGTVTINNGTIVGRYAGILNNISNEKTSIVNINGGVVKATQSGGSNSYGIYNQGTNTTYPHTVTITGGTVGATDGDLYGIYNYGVAATTTVSGGYVYGSTSGIGNAGTVNIENGTVSARGQGIHNSVSVTETSIVNISGGLVKATQGSDGYGIWNTGTNTTYPHIVTITGGTVGATDGDNYGISNSGVAATTTIKGGYVCGSNSAISNGGTVNIENGIVSAPYAGIYSSSAQRTTTVNISGGLVKATESGGLNGYGIYTQGTNTTYPQTVTITGGTVGSTDVKYGIYNYGAAVTTTVKGGNVYGSDRAINNSSSATTYIGDETAILSTSSPLISGGTYGLYNSSASWYFYNGKIQGTEMAYNGSYTGVRDGYAVKSGTEGSYKTAYLGKIDNPTTISAVSPLLYGISGNMVSVSNQTNVPYYAVGTQLTSSNYSSSGSTTIPTISGKAVGTYTVYYYIPAGGVYNAKSGSVSVTIRYVKAEEVSYTPSDSGWNPGNVQNALDILYSLLQ